LAFHFSLSLTPNYRNWSPNYSVLVFLIFSFHCFESAIVNTLQGRVFGLQPIAGAIAGEEKNKVKFISPRTTRAAKVQFLFKQR
jgi:hypothetical protein